MYKVGDLVLDYVPITYYIITKVTANKYYYDVYMVGKFYKKHNLFKKEFEQSTRLPSPLEKVLL